MDGKQERWVWGLVGVGLGTAFGYWWVKRQQQQQAAMLTAGAAMLPQPQTGQEAAGAVGEFPQAYRKMRVTPGYASDAVPTETEAVGEPYAVDEFAGEDNNGEF